MKKKIGLMVVIVVIALGLGTVLLREQKSDTPQSIVAVNQDERTANAMALDVPLSFVVLGDIHTNLESMQTAIDDLQQINPKLTALVLNGDTVDQGLENQYQELKKLLGRNQSKLPPMLIKNIGNHEFFNYQIKENSPQEVQGFITRYLDFSGEAKVYHDKWIKGFHFISLGSEDGNSKTIDSIRAYISPEQQRWLREKLLEKHEKKKPIFVFLHQPLNTNSSSGWIGTDQGKEILKILSEYPEVILFGSHTHRPLDESIILTKQPFTVVHTGAVHYTIVPDGKGGRTREAQVNGVYIEVSDKIIVIKGRNSKDHSWAVSKEIMR